MYKYLFIFSLPQTGLSGNVIVLSVFYGGGYMMSQSMLSIGDLSAFILYAAYVGVAMGGNSFILSISWYL